MAQTRIQSGDVVDGFLVGAELRSGGAAVLFEATHPGHGLPLIMKVPRLGPDQPTAGVIGFETECMIMPVLRGPHVPRFIAAGALEARPYLVMERIDGGSLDDRVIEDGLPVDQVTQLGSALALATHALHRQDVIHLDIKPGNVVMRPDGSAVLIDFGFSRHAHFPDLFQEESRRAVGSPPYIAPEQIDGVRSDLRSDIFAIGVSLYEWATGTLPFGVPANEREMRNRLWTEPPPPRALNPAFPPWLQEIILTCLEPSPDARFASAAVLARSLADPSGVVLTERAERTTAPTLLRQIRRSMSRRKTVHTPRTSPSEQIDTVPLILAAVDLSADDEKLSRAIADATRRALARHPQSRLSCVSVLPDGPSSETAETAESIRHHAHLVRLRAWLTHHGLPPERTTLHVFETNEPATRIVQYARDNHVDAVIIGAAHRLHGKMGLGRSVMTKIAEEAPCSVHIIRVVEG